MRDQFRACRVLLQSEEDGAPRLSYLKPLYRMEKE